MNVLEVRGENRRSLVPLIILAKMSFNQHLEILEIHILILSHESIDCQSDNKVYPLHILFENIIIEQKYIDIG